MMTMIRTTMMMMMHALFSMRNIMVPSVDSIIIHVNQMYKFKMSSSIHMIHDFQLLHSLHVEIFVLEKVINLTTKTFSFFLNYICECLEICWDYNYIVGCMPDVRIDCQCQASNCRGRLL